MGKKVFWFCLFLFLFFLPSPVRAACSPPNDYSSCPEQDPNYNLDVAGLEPVSGRLETIEFNHETDPKAPQLGTLLEGEARPEITGLYRVSGDYVPSDINYSDFASAVGFATQTDQAVLVPNSGYDIGGGFEATVLYASPNSITLKYTAEDSITQGYTIHLENFQVDSNLLSFYNQLSQAGRSQLPVLLAGEQIGFATGEELIVAIRDTGSLMDPRWIGDWWVTIDPATGQVLVLRSRAVLKTTTFQSLTCNPSISGSQDSRPVECEACNRTNLFTPSCATSFSVNDQVKYNRGDGLSTSPHCVEKSWGGTVVIDPSNVTLPFAGKKGQENEQKYLADYFEGTTEYYQQKNYPNYWLDWVDHGGVFRKLTPMEYQDQMKKKMVARAQQTTNIQKSGTHNYNVSYQGRLCWNLPLLAEAFLLFVEKTNIINEIKSSWSTLPVTDLALGDFQTLLSQVLQKSHYCIYEDLWITKTAIDIFNRFSPLNIAVYQYADSQNQPLRSLVPPPNLTDPDYAKKWQDWKNSASGKLWTAAPMFTREDTPGEIIPYVGTRSKDNVGLSGSLIEKVPHVARLYEISQQINKLLFPSGSKRFLVKEEKENKPIIASSQVLGEKTLLAASDEWDFCEPTGNACDNLSIRSICCSAGSGTVVVDGSGYGHVTVTVNGSMVGFNALGQGLTYYFGCPANPGETFSVSINATNYDIGHTVSGGCSTTLDQNASACCSGGQPPVIPLTCGISNLSPVSSCSYPAIADTNPNDKLCCGEINVDLRAVDAFENPEYEKCRQEGYICEPIPNCLFPGTPICQTCRSACDEQITKDVSREVGVNLRHPYLSAIWDQTGDTEGLFNIFRPSEISQFEEVAARSQIKYRYTDTSDPKVGEANPGGGDFYFPYLGGIQTAKNWLVKSLFPSSGTSSSPSSPITLDYSVDYRNSSFVINEEVKADIIQRVKNRWPSSQIEENWDLVYQEAISHGFNPAFVIAIWIEESGASGVTAWDLGCGSGPKNNLTDQLDCFFNRLPWLDEETTFEEFMCYYSDGHYPCNFSAHPNFPGGVKYWLDLLTRQGL